MNSNGSSGVGFDVDELNDLVSEARSGYNVPDGSDGRGFRGLRAWQSAMDVVADVYRVSRAFPKDEQFGLTSQLRRCAVSVPSNIAEGWGRNGPIEFARFIDIAIG